MQRDIRNFILTSRRLRHVEHAASMREQEMFSDHGWKVPEIHTIEDSKRGGNIVLSIEVG
jgi:hypothetical protein